MSDAAPRGFDLHELSAGRAALGSIRRRPAPFVAATIASWAVLLVALVVVASSALVDQILSRASQSAGVVVVIRDAASVDQVEAVRKALAGVGGSGPPSAPERPGADDLGLKQLPSLLRVSAAANSRDLAAWVSAVRQSVSSLPAVEAIRVDESWIRSLDRWRLQWIQIKPWFSGIAAAILAVFLASTWFLEAASRTDISSAAGTYISLLGLALAGAGCACVGGLILLRIPDFLTWLDDEWRLNALFVLGFSIVLALAGTKAASAGR